MNNIPIPPVNTLVNLQPVAVSNTTQNPSQAASPLVSVPNGTIISGFVINRDAQNQPILRTQFGDVLVNTQLFLKTGAEVMLRVDNSQPSNARLISINGQSPEVYAKLQAAQSAIPGDEVVETANIPLAAGAAPKPVQMPGFVLQLQPEESLPPALLQNALTILTGQPTIPNTATALPITIILRALIGRAATTSNPTPAIQPPSIPNQVPLTPEPHTVPVTAALPEATLSQEDAALLAQISGKTNPLTAQIPKATIPAIVVQEIVGEAPPDAPIPISTTILPQTVVRQQNVTSAQVMLPEIDIGRADNPATTQPLSPQQVVIPKPLFPTPNTIMETRVPGEMHPAFKPLFPEAQLTIPSAGTVRMEAKVIGQEASGDVVMHTPIGIIKALTARPLPIGSTISVDLKPGLPSETAVQEPIPSSLPDDMQELTQISRDWPALSRLLDAIKTADVPMYQAMAQQMLPNTGPNLTNGMLFFLSALKAGDIKSWMGDKVLKALETKQPELLSRLSAEFGGLVQASTQSSNQGWLSTIIPILHEDALHQARLFIRQDGGEQQQKQGGGKNQGQRFIIEVDLTQLGEMQFDGFVTKDDGRNQFDMIVRSTRPLPLDMQQDIRDLYDKAAGAAGFKGMLTFQASAEQFVRPLSSMGKDIRPGILA